MLEKTTSCTCAPTCSGRRRRGPPNALDRSPEAGLWLRTGPQFLSVKPTLPLRGVRYATFRPGVQRRARTGETSADPAAQRSPAAAGNRSGRVWEPNSRRPPAVGHSHLADGAGRLQPGALLAGSRAVRSVLGDHRRPLLGPRPPGGRRRRRDPGCSDPALPSPGGGGPAGRRGGAQAAERAKLPAAQSAAAATPTDSSAGQPEHEGGGSRSQALPTRGRGAPGECGRPWQPPAGGKGKNKAQRRAQGQPGFHPPGGGAPSGLIRKHPQWLVNGFPGTSARAAFKVRFSVSTRGPRLWPGGPSAVPSIVTLPEPSSGTRLWSPQSRTPLGNLLLESSYLHHLHLELTYLPGPACLQNQTLPNLLSLQGYPRPFIISLVMAGRR